VLYRVRSKSSVTRCAMLESLPARDGNRPATLLPMNCLHLHPHTNKASSTLSHKFTLALPQLRVMCEVGDRKHQHGFRKPKVIPSPALSLGSDSPPTATHTVTHSFDADLGSPRTNNLNNIQLTQWSCSCSQSLR